MANTWRSLYFALCLICIGLLCRSWVELRLASNDCELKSCTPLCWPVVWSGLDKETPAITPVGPTHHWPTHRPPVEPVVFLHTPCPTRPPVGGVTSTSTPALWPCAVLWPCTFCSDRVVNFSCSAKFCIIKIKTNVWLFLSKVDQIKLHDLHKYSRSIFDLHAMFTAFKRSA